jgi:hypothetical protein
LNERLNENNMNSKQDNNNTQPRTTHLSGEDNPLEQNKHPKSENQRIIISRQIVHREHYQSGIGNDGNTSDDL